MLGEGLCQGVLCGFVLVYQKEETDCVDTDFPSPSLSPCAAVLWMTKPITCINFDLFLFFFPSCSRILQLENQLQGMHNARKRARLEDEKYEMESQAKLLQERERLHKVRMKSLWVAMHVISFWGLESLQY